MDDELNAIITKAKSKADLRMKDPAFAKELARTFEDKQMVGNAVTEVRDSIFNRQLPPDQTSFSFIPTEMTRLSPFFPISDMDKAKREYKEMTWENSWGRMSIKGIKLSIYDEDILLALVKLFKKHQSLTLNISRGEIFKAIGKTKGANANIALSKSIERLTGTLVTIEVWDNIKTKNPVTKMGNTILSGYVMNKRGGLTVTLNPYFQEAYLETMVTSLDLDFRMSLKHDVAKSLHRFLESQNKDYQIHIDKLVLAININANQERKHIRDILRKALNELVEKKYLEFFHIKDEIIITRRVGNSIRITER